MDLRGFADEIGASGEVTITGAATRGGPVPGVRVVRAPTGIDWLRGDEMTVCCGAGTLVADLDEALAAVGQSVAIPPSGTVGGALAVGRSGLRRLGYGPIRDTLLQARYVSAAGDVVKAGGPTVKNVSGFDLCRLLVGSCGHARLPRRGDPAHAAAGASRAVVRNDGRSDRDVPPALPPDVGAVGRHDDVGPARGTPRRRGGDWPRRPGSSRQPARRACRRGGRWSIPPAELRSLRGTFVAEVGVGIVHHADPPPAVEISVAVRELNRRIKHNFDPTGRLNPGLDVVATDTPLWRNVIEMRGSGVRALLGDGVLPVMLTGAPITKRSPWPTS